LKKFQVKFSANRYTDAMSLYWETADLLTAPANSGGSLKSRIFSKKDLKSQPAQIYALAIETCKWSSVLREVVENADILRVERKVSTTSNMIVHKTDYISLLADTYSFNPSCS
jgi:hypothetical protein